MGNTGNSIADHAAALLLSRSRPVPHDGRHDFRSRSRKPRMLLLGRHGPHFELLQDGEHGPCSVAAAVCGARRGNKRGGVPGMRTHDVGGDG